jgi:hypothetical protein
MTAEQLDVLGQRLGPARRALPHVVDPGGQAVQVRAESGHLPLAHLLDGQFQALEPLSDLLERGGRGSFFRRVVLYRSRE